LRDELEEETKNLMVNQWRVLGRVFSTQSCTFSTIESKEINGGKGGGRREERVAFMVWRSNPW
jgi:hypothetical protein